MNALDAVVIAGGLTAILWVNWYFFRAGRSTVQAAVDFGGAQVVEVIVQGGYEPNHVRVRRGVPVRLVFDRRETSGCSEEVVIPAFGIRRFLPAHARTTVEFIPEAAGDFDFTCGMSMLRGRITVEEGVAP